MKTIEELLVEGDNRNRFKRLIKEIEKGKLAVYFGAGLSLWEDYQSWDYPFIFAQEKAEEYLKKIQNYYKNKKVHPATAKALETRTKLLDEGKICKDNLKWGSILNDVMKKLYASYQSCALHGDFNEYKTFSHACVQAFNATTAPDFDFPYEIPALYYLPYLSNILVTTNVDNSFEIVCKNINDNNWSNTAVDFKKNIKLDLWKEKPRSIFYIHGHIKIPETLVMTEDDYNKMYPEVLPAYDGLHGSREILKYLVNNYSILFLGASLQNDRTVKIINYENELLEPSNMHYLFPMASININGKLNKPPKIKNGIPLTYNMDSYDEISLWLLYMIRETSPKIKWDTNGSWINDECAYNETGCTWREPLIDGEFNGISESLQTIIDVSLSRDETFENINVSVSMKPSELVHYLFSKYSNIYREDGPGWSICTIFNNNFTLNGYKKMFSPLHNYPIGDTVYVLLGDINLKKEHEDRIYNEIKNGCSQTRTNGPKKNEKNPPRIRIIVLEPNREIKPTQNFINELCRVQKQGTKLSGDEQKTMVQSVVTPAYQEVSSNAIADAKDNTIDEREENRIDETKEHLLTLTQKP